MLLYNIQLSNTYNWSASLWRYVATCPQLSVVLFRLKSVYNNTQNNFIYLIFIEKEFGIVFFFHYLYISKVQTLNTDIIKPHGAPRVSFHNMSQCICQSITLTYMTQTWAAWFILRYAYCICTRVNIQHAHTHLESSVLWNMRAYACYSSCITYCNHSTTSAMRKSLEHPNIL